jgi:catalase
MANALHTAFGEHHTRAVHTKGILLEGTFTPTKEARTIVKEPIFAGGTLPRHDAHSLRQSLTQTSLNLPAGSCRSTSS